MDPSDDTSPTPTLEPPLDGIGGNNHEDGLLAAPLLSFILDLLVDPESTIIGRTISITSPHNSILTEFGLCQGLHEP